MESLIQQLIYRFQPAVSAVLGTDFDISSSIVPASRPEFGDYQANFSMRFAKQLGKNPRELAELIIQKVETVGLIASLEVAGPGFINIRLAHDYYAEILKNLVLQPVLQPVEHSLTIVVDYGGANVAKEMHVGHLRSTIIGDAIVRLLTARGHHVIRQNHLGDFGTQFGMLVQYILDHAIDLTTLREISDLNALYQAAKQHFDADEAFSKKARARVVKLQAKDPETRAIWQILVDLSVDYFQKTYDRLDVLLKPSDNRGESFYEDRLGPLVQDLLKRGVAERSEGAIVVFLEGYFNQNQEPLPFLIEKSDGGYLYATTDLATFWFRVHELAATRLIYVTDARQKQHFAMLFDTVRKAGWVGQHLQLNHVSFGSVLGEDGKPFKTRSGESVKLADLIDEAEERAFKVIQSRDPDLPFSDQKKIAHHVGIGALKYADLSSDRERDYVFSWDRMLAFEGNTAPYLQNAYVRICSIFRKAGLAMSAITAERIVLTETCERQLAIKILEFPDVVISIESDCLIHRLCHYLYELASGYHRFYETCSVLNAEDDYVRQSRLLLSAVTAKVLGYGLSLLGVVALERM